MTGSVTVLPGCSCAKEACPRYTRYADQKEDEADALLLNGYRS